MISTTMATEIARRAYEADRSFHRSLGVINIRPWAHADQWVRDEFIYVVRELVEHPLQNTPRHLHTKWCRDQRADGWTYGPVLDPKKKTHPRLIAYGKLPLRDRIKDAIFQAVVDSSFELMQPKDAF